MSTQIKQVGDSTTFTVTVTVTADFKPHVADVAAMFCAFDAHAQASVLALIALTAEGWPDGRSGAQKQWLHIASALRAHGPRAVDMLRDIVAFYDEEQRT